jgi:N-methylhydantoinase A
VKNDYVQTQVARHTTLDRTAVEGILDALTGRAAAALDTEGFARDQHEYARTADLRYFGQAYEVRVPVGPGRLDEAAADAVAERFHDEHRQLYGYDFRDDPRQQVEWVNLRVTGIGPITRPEIRQIASRAPMAGATSTNRSILTQPEHLAPRSSRDVCFDADAGYVAADVYWRLDLRAGDTFAGPAIVEEFGSTVPVHPGFTVRVDAFGNLVVTKEAQ